MDTESLVILLISFILFFLWLFAIFIANDTDNNTAELPEMKKELKEIDDKYQPLIDKMWTVYWYGKKLLEAKTQEELDFCKKQQDEASELFIKWVINKKKEIMLVYKKYGMKYQKEDV